LQVPGVHPALNGLHRHAESLGNLNRGVGTEALIHLESASRQA